MGASQAATDPTDELAEWREAAEQAGLTLVGFVRRCVGDAIALERAQNHWPPVADPPSRHEPAPIPFSPFRDVRR